MVDLPSKPRLPEDDESWMVARRGDGDGSGFRRPVLPFSNFILRSRGQVRDLVVSVVLIGFLEMGLWVSKKDPISAEKKGNTI